MTTPDTLRFRARGTAMVPHFERMYAGTNSFVGRKMIAVNGKATFQDIGVEEVPLRPEYLNEAAHGNLWPADEETAKACTVYAKAHGFAEVVFDPTFGTGISVRSALVALDAPATEHVDHNEKG